MQRKNKILALMLAFLLIVGGCSVIPSNNELQSAFEKLAESEEEFNKQQAPLVELERKEKEIYDQIMVLGMKEFPKIVDLSEEALELIRKRKKRIAKEYESVQLAKKQLEFVEKEISKLPDDGIKKEAVQLTDLLRKRYGVYDELHHHYQKALTLETELYNMFQDKRLTLEQLERQVSQINSVYENIIKTNEQFNLYTVQYNKAKKILFNKLN